jgi:tetratricopeptide (TPR) repeat protein
VPVAETQIVSDSSLARALRSAAQSLEGDEAAGWPTGTAPAEEEGGSPVEDARQVALADLAEFVFEENSAGVGAELSKSDRDSLISKAIEYQTRGEIDEAIDAYSLAETYAVKGEQEQAVAFTTALAEFLSTKGWEDKVKDARQRLDGLAAEGQTMSLAEILAVPGSEQLLESISMTNEYSRRGWLDTALEECYQAVQLAPFYLPAHLWLARLLEQRGQIEASGKKYVTVSRVYRARGDPTRAMDALERATVLAPLDMVLRSRLIEMLKRHGEIDRALDHSMALAEAYYQLAQVDKARDKYQDALQLAPRGSPEKQWGHHILHRIADIDMQRLSWRDAARTYHQIIQLAPDDERAAGPVARSAGGTGSLLGGPGFAGPHQKDPCHSQRNDLPATGQSGVAEPAGGRVCPGRRTGKGD